MVKLASIDKRTANDWLAYIDKLEGKVSESEHRVADIEAGCRRLSLMADEGSKQSQKDLERQNADLSAATIDRDTLRDRLVAAREFSQEASVREEDAADQAVRSRIASLANVRSEQAVEAQKAINKLTIALNEMYSTGTEIDRLARHADLRHHYLGEGFSSRICQAIGPALKRFGILAHTDASHPKFGQELTVGEGAGTDALAMLDRAIKQEAQNQARRDAHQARTYGATAA
jgi:hypothetical protein